MALGTKFQTLRFLVVLLALQFNAYILFAAFAIRIHNALRFAVRLHEQAPFAMVNPGSRTGRAIYVDSHSGRHSFRSVYYYPLTFPARRARRSEGVTLLIRFQVIENTPLPSPSGTIAHKSNALNKLLMNVPSPLYPIGVP